MRVSLRNGKVANVRRLEMQDQDALYNYFQRLSIESKSRFGPHPFDRNTIASFLHHPDSRVHRYIAVDLLNEEIVAYMLIHDGMIDGDLSRYASRGEFFDPVTTVTFAPSVADEWQSSGLGSAMALIIEQELVNRGVRTIILWGGVQATNTKAVNFYEKLGYQFQASFWFDDKDNNDMLKELGSTL